jgi:hypothetical protein
MANDPVSVRDQDAAFEAWLSGLRFVIEPAELGRVRAGFDRLAVMNRINRTLAAQQRTRRAPGVDA